MSQNYVVRMKFGDNFVYFDPKSLKFVPTLSGLNLAFTESGAREVIAAAGVDAEAVPWEQAVREHR
jgi:hypothetical protein